MKNTKHTLYVLAVFVLTSCLVHAQATRTWVSGVGDDANPCSRTAPCKTFAGAISKTAAGGEIDAMDPGGFGAVTITKAITIDGGSGQVGSILVSGTNGIVVQAGASDVVTIRNVSINGIGSGIDGIRFLGGKALQIENCKIFGFTSNGIDIESPGGIVNVLDTVSHNNGNGMYVQGFGNPVQANIDRSRFTDNSLAGIWASDLSRFSVSNSQMLGNQYGLVAQGGGGTAVVGMANSTLGNNSIGIFSGGGAGSSSVRITGVSLFLNGTGIWLDSNGQVASFGNNYNSDSGAPNSKILQQ